MEESDPIGNRVDGVGGLIQQSMICIPCRRRGAGVEGKGERE